MPIPRKELHVTNNANIVPEWMWLSYIQNDKEVDKSGILYIYDILSYWRCPSMMVSVSKERATWNIEQHLNTLGLETSAIGGFTISGKKYINEYGTFCKVCDITALIIEKIESVEICENFENLSLDEVIIKLRDDDYYCKNYECNMFSLRHDTEV